MKALVKTVSLAGKSVAQRLLLAVAFLALSSIGAFAQVTPPDASDIVDTATATFNSVGTLVVAAVTFFIIVKIVKWVRK